MIKRVLSMILILSIVVCPVFSAYALTDDEMYTAAMDELRVFMGAYSSRQDDATLSKLDDLWDKFDDLGNYLLSRRFLDYIDVLRDIEKNEYGEISIKISNLEKSGNLKAFLAAENEKAIKEGKMSLGSLDELAAYAAARKAQHENDISQALKHYENCTDFLDSYDRQIKLSKEHIVSNYNKALEYMRQNNQDGYIKARDLLIEPAEIDYLDSKNLLSIVEDCILQFSASLPASTSTSKSVTIKDVEYEWTANVMSECHEAYQQSDFDCLSSFQMQSGIKRFQIVSVSFVNTLKNAPSDSYDISLTGDNSVQMWFEKASERVADLNGNQYSGYRAYIGARGTIYAAASVYGLFSNYINCKEIDFNHCFDTYMVRNMREMFSYCTSLTTLDVSSFNTENTINMTSMFDNCSSLIAVDVDGIDTANVTHMTSMFNNCRSLTALNLSKFDTKNVIDMWGMFNECIALTSLNISGFNTRNVTVMSWMFRGCSSLKALDVSGFDTRNVTTMSWMFRGCSSLTALDVSGFDTGNVATMSGMFRGCSSLTSLDVSGFDTSNVTDASELFYWCSGLKRLIINKSLEKKLDSGSLKGVTAKRSYQ